MPRQSLDMESVGFSAWSCPFVFLAVPFQRRTVFFSHSKSANSTFLIDYESVIDRLIQRRELLCLRSEISAKAFILSFPLVLRFAKNTWIA